MDYKASRATYGPRAIAFAWWSKKYRSVGHVMHLTVCFLLWKDGINRMCWRFLKQLLKGARDKKCIDKLSVLLFGALEMEKEMQVTNQQRVFYSRQNCVYPIQHSLALKTRETGTKERDCFSTQVPIWLKILPNGCRQSASPPNFILILLVSKIKVESSWPGTCGAEARRVTVSLLQF